MDCTLHFKIIVLLFARVLYIYIYIMYYSIISIYLIFWEK